MGYDSKLPFANQIGAVDRSYNIAEAVEQIHDLGGRVVGRIVAFRDPVLARYAWDHGHHEQVIQAPGGRPVLGSGYGGFTNFADPAVRKYNIDIAVEATKAGVNDILYDYIRRPDGPLSTMVFPGLRGGAERSIVVVPRRRADGPRPQRRVPRGLGVRHRGLRTPTRWRRTWRGWPGTSTTSRPSSTPPAGGSTVRHRRTRRWSHDKVNRSRSTASSCSRAAARAGALAPGLLAHGVTYGPAR